MDLSAIPHSPGVYLMRDNTGRIVYVGKARDLAKRVASYFSGKLGLPMKTSFLVSTVHHIDYIPTRNEREALMVERNLIHTMQPHYNISWKDDKSYPYIKITTNEDFPRIYLTRKVTKDGATYF